MKRIKKRTYLNEKQYKNATMKNSIRKKGNEYTIEYQSTN